MKGYGKKLVQLRGNKTIEQVAKDLGVSRSAIAMYESEDRTPRDSVKIKIAEYYGKTVQEIFFNRECHDSLHL